MSKVIVKIEFDRYSNEHGVFYSRIFHVGKEFVLNGNKEKCYQIDEVKYHNVIKYEIKFESGAIYRVNDREDLNLIFDKQKI